MPLVSSRAAIGGIANQSKTVKLFLQQRPVLLKKIRWMQVVKRLRGLPRGYRDSALGSPDDVRTPRAKSKRREVEPPVLDPWDLARSDGEPRFGFRPIAKSRRRYERAQVICQTRMGEGPTLASSERVARLGRRPAVRRFSDQVVLAWASCPVFAAQLYCRDE